MHNCKIHPSDHVFFFSISSELNHSFSIRPHKYEKFSCSSDPTCCETELKRELQEKLRHIYLECLLKCILAHLEGHILLFCMFKMVRHSYKWIHQFEEIP